MAPIPGSVLELGAGSPIAIMLSMTVVAAAVLASLLIAVLVCACGKKDKKEVPTTTEDQAVQPMPEQGQETVDNPPPVQSKSQIEEQSTGKTAMDAPSVKTHVSQASCLGAVEKAPDLQLMSQLKSAGVGGGGPRSLGTKTHEMASLQLTGTSLHSQTVETSKAKEGGSVSANPSPSKIVGGTRSNLKSVKSTSVAVA